MEDAQEAAPDTHPSFPFLSSPSFPSSCSKWKMDDYKYLEFTIVIIASAYLTIYFAHRAGAFFSLGILLCALCEAGKRKYADSDSYQFLPASSVH